MKNNLIKKIFIFGLASIFSISLSCSAIKKDVSAQKAFYTTNSRDLFVLNDGYVTTHTSYEYLSLWAGIDAGTVHFSFKNHDGEITMVPEGLFDLNWQTEYLKKVCDVADLNKDRIITEEETYFHHQNRFAEVLNNFEKEDVTMPQESYFKKGI